MTTDNDNVDPDTPSNETPLVAPEGASTAAATAATIGVVIAAGYGIYKGGQKVVGWVRPRLTKTPVAPVTESETPVSGTDED